MYSIFRCSLQFQRLTVRAPDGGLQVVIKKESIEDGAQTASPERRRALRKIAAGLGTLAGYSVLPEQWTRPVISHVVLPAHAETSGEFPQDPGSIRPTLQDPCSLQLLWRDRDYVIIQVEGYLTPPTGNVNVTIAAEFDAGIGNTVSTTTTDAGGHFSEILTVTVAGKGNVVVTTSAAGADGVGHCSISTSSNPVGTPAPNPKGTPSP